MSENNRIRIKRGDYEVEVEGNAEFVEKHIALYKKEFDKMKTSSNSIVGQENKPNSLTGGSPSLPNTIVEFYREKNPESQRETVVLVAYWLTKKEGKEEFKPKEISALYEKLNLKKIRNIHQAIRVVSSGNSAFLTDSTTAGHYKITLTGMDFIEHELPRKKKSENK